MSNPPERPSLPDDAHEPPSLPSPTSYHREPSRTTREVRNVVSPMIHQDVSAPLPPQRQIGPEPTYPIAALIAAVGLTVEELAEVVGISRATAYRRAKNGVQWSEADDWSVALGFLPFEIWPEWADSDPAEWWDMPHDPELESAPFIDGSGSLTPCLNGLIDPAA